MPNNGYFDIKRDNELIAAGTHFWCEACLMAKPVDDMSRDQRYCQGCYDFLVYEAALLVEKGSTRRPYWWPQGMEQGTEKEKKVSQDTSFNLSTLKAGKTKVDKLVPMTPIVTREKPGPRLMELPDDKIQEWASQGMGSKAIATKLEKEYRVVVSYKTIQRRLQGELI